MQVKTCIFLNEQTLSSAVDIRYYNTSFFDTLIFTSNEPRIYLSLAQSDFHLPWFLLTFQVHH